MRSLQTGGFGDVGDGYIGFIERAGKHLVVVGVADPGEPGRLCTAAAAYRRE